MTDRELAAAAWLELTKTTDSYPTWKRKGFPPRSHWGKAKAFLDQIGAAPPPPPPAPPAVGVFVSPTGDDATGDGSQSKPWQTLPHAQYRMRIGGPQVCYLRGGTYPMPESEPLYGLRLTQQDSGQSWLRFENEPVVLDGGSKDANTGTHVILVADGASNVTFDGLEVTGFRWVGIGVHGGGNGLQLFPQTVGPAKDNTIRNCHIHDGCYDTSPVYGYGGAPIYGRGNIPGLTIDHNAIHDVPTGGIVAPAGDGAGPHFVDNLRITNNAVYKTCQKINDAGGIYTQDVNATSTGIAIANNFVRDCGGGRGIYLDDGLCNAQVTGNIVAGIFDIACMIHGGRMNKWRGNLVDIEKFSTNGPRVMRFQGSSIPTDHQGNEWTNNIVISSAARWPVYWNDFPMVIRDNLYWTYAGTKIDPAGDANPTWADPKLSGRTYDLAADSPAYQAPVSFPALVRNWGPPGYVIPAGTNPSYIA